MNCRICQKEADWTLALSSNKAINTHAIHVCQHHAMHLSILVEEMIVRMKPCIACDEFKVPSGQALQSEDK